MKVDCDGKWKYVAVTLSVCLSLYVAVFLCRCLSVCFAFTLVISGVSLSTALILARLWKCQRLRLKTDRQIDRHRVFVKKNRCRYRSSHGL